jgi:hypothetical protein
MRDLLIITPTRGRPASAQRLINAVQSTATAQTDLVLAVDDDDLGTYEPLSLTGQAYLMSGPRTTCPAWTNRVAARYEGEYRAFASLGDDHVPETPGWDSILLGAIDAMGGTGLAFGWDCVRPDQLATAPVISASIVAALGWLMLPTVQHVFADDCWTEIAREAGCLRYVPEVIIRHLHWSNGTAPRDVTYLERDHLWPADEAAYHAWQREGKAADVEKVRALCRGAS